VRTLPLDSASIIGGINVVATLISIFIVDRFGRKILFLCGGCIMVLMQVSMLLFVQCVLCRNTVFVVALSYVAHESTSHSQTSQVDQA